MPDIYDFIKELAPLEIEYVDDNDNYHCLNAYIKRVDEESILISPPQKNNLTYNLLDGQEVNIIFKTPKGIYSAVSSVVSKQLDSMSGLNISFPHSSQLLERREFLRVPLQLKIDIVKFLDNTQENVENFSVQSRNISGSGLCYISDKPLTNYYDIHCKIYLDTEKDPIYTRCDHLYSKKIKINNEKAYLTALTFIEMTEEDIAKIVKECFKYQIGNREKLIID